MKTDMHLWSYLAEFYLEWEMFHENVVEKIKTHTLCSEIYFWNSCRLRDNAENYVKAGQATVTVRHKIKTIRIPNIYSMNTHTHTHNI